MLGIFSESKELDGVGLLTAREVFDKLSPEMSFTNVMVLLKRYHSFGYLHRHKNDKGKFVYRINPSGVIKLNYLKSVMI